ncbi:hypothetical protein EMIT0P218_70246 [Pseudomonas sp. IT-P218]
MDAIEGWGNALIYGGLLSKNAANLVLLL